LAARLKRGGPDMNLRGEGKMPSRLPAGRRRYSMPLPEARRMSEARRD
jgi:hypothetical protein